jgi:hypothetical protein
MDVDSIVELFQSSASSGSKSTIIKPLSWAIATVLLALLILVKLNAPNWIMYLMAGFLVLFVLLFIAVYVYCILNMPDTLRSEKFTIEKMAIEKGIYGDDKTGIQDVEAVDVTETVRIEPKK